VAAQDSSGSKAGQIIFNLFKNIFDLIQCFVHLGKLPGRDAPFNVPNIAL
jgi:hypothetical protein